MKRAISACAAALAAGLASAGAFAAGPGPADSKPIRVALRYDDCSARSPEGLEDSILAACARYGIPVTFGVIPEPDRDGSQATAPSAGPLPPGRAQKLAAAARAGSLEIALHGCVHRSRVRGGKSEFAGVDSRQQDSLLARGLAALRPLEPSPRTFIPPWNAYDEATLAALERNGFRTLSAIAGGPYRIGARMANLAFVPATCLLPEVRAAVAEARRRGGGDIIPYFHPYEFKEIDSLRGFFTLGRFDTTLAWLASQPDVEAVTLGSLGNAPEARAAAYAGYSRWHVLTPSALERTLRPAYRVYPQAGFPMAGGGLWLRLALLSGYLAAALPAFALARLLSGFARPAAASRRSATLRAALAIAGSGALVFGISGCEPLWIWLGLSGWAGCAGMRRPTASPSLRPIGERVLVG